MSLCEFRRFFWMTNVVQSFFIDQNGYASIFIKNNKRGTDSEVTILIPGTIL